VKTAAASVAVPLETTVEECATWTLLPAVACAVT
jgi:hypothetical protein